MTAPLFRREARLDSDRSFRVRTLDFQRTGSALSVRRRVLSVMLPFAVGACGQGFGGRDDSAAAAIPGNESREISIEIDRARATMSRREWSESHGDTADALVGFFAGDSLRLVRERVTRGERESSANRYYYAGGALRYYESEGEQSKADSAQALVTQKTRTALAFDAAGSLVEGSHQVNSQTVAIDSLEVRRVLQRAAALKERAASAPAAPARTTPG